MTHRTLNSAWDELWPDSVVERDFDRFVSDGSTRIDEVVSMVKSIGLDVESEDVHELLKSQVIELKMEELQEEQQKTLADDLSSDEDEVKESVLSSLNKEVCEMG